MKLQTKLIIGGSIVAATGVTVYAVKKRKSAQPAVKVEEYLFQLKDDAEIVLDQLKESVKKYGAVTIVDYYDLIGEGSSFVLNQYGWNEKGINKAKIKKVKGGFTIIFPKVVNL